MKLYFVTRNHKVGDLVYPDIVHTEYEEACKELMDLETRLTPVPHYGPFKIYRVSYHKDEDSIVLEEEHG